jgi:hypothetical protein
MFVAEVSNSRSCRAPFIMEVEGSYTWFDSSLQFEYVLLINSTIFVGYLSYALLAVGKVTMGC